MHFSTIGSKKAFRKKISITNEDKGNSPPPRKIDKKEKRRRIIRIILSLTFLFFFILLFVSLRIFGSDNYYTVKRDETSEMIARKFNIPHKVLLNLNDMSDTRQIKEGMRIQIPYSYDIYVAKAGDTLYDIALANGVKQFELANHNKFIGTREVKPGEIIHIPRILQDIRIKCSKYTGLKPFKVEFSVATNTRGKVKHYKWDLGDENYSNKKSPIHTFKEKGIYKVSLEVTDENNNEIVSNTLTINVRALANITFTTTEYFEVNPGEIIDLKASAIDNLGDPVEFDYTTRITGSPKLIEQMNRTDKFRVLKPSQSNFSTLKIECEGYTHTVNLFVSPIPSKHNTRPDIPWYRTQFKTGLNGNCGPACAAMVAVWATGKEIEVSSIRNFIGLPYESGAIGFNHIILALEKYRVKSQYYTVNNIQDFIDIIDRGNIAIVLFNMGEIERVKGKKQYDLFGSYYNEDGGHYAIVKGYSLNHKYLVVNDPMPGDWWLNSERYDDGESMIGRNRYYSTETMLRAMRIRTVLEIMK